MGNVALRRHEVVPDGKFDDFGVDLNLKGFVASEPAGDHDHGQIRTIGFAESVEKPVMGIFRALNVAGIQAIEKIAGNGQAAVHCSCIIHFDFLL